MADPVAFIDKKRQKTKYRPVEERVKDYKDVAIMPTVEESQEQGSRCLDCSTPFCHWGCPTANIIPELNTHVAYGEWEKAYRYLKAHCNLPEMTGRLCPAPCQDACVLNANAEDDDSVTIREIELAIIEYAFEHGFVKPEPPKVRTDKKVAVIGSGPAGITAADQLNQAGHNVTVFERDEKVGGLLRYGIPDFKLEKWVIDRRQKLLEEEGLVFKTGIAVGTDYPVDKLKKDFDAVVLAGGSRKPRDLPIEGRDLKGIHFAMDFLSQSNRKVDGIDVPEAERITAEGKHVIVIGGGDTGSDCVGTSHRQGARSVTQLEIMPQPPKKRGPNDFWPDYARTLRVSSSHLEGGQRNWSVLTKRFSGEDGNVKRLEATKVEVTFDGETGRPNFNEVKGSDFSMDADLVVLAMGFVSPEQDDWLSQLGVDFTDRGPVAVDPAHMTKVKGVFSTGDMRRGQSLVTWAIAEGRKTAHFVDTYLMGSSNLPPE